MPPPRRSQEQRREATRAALLAAGRALFVEHGATAVSAEQVAVRAGVTRGALYHHFQDKNDLFAAVFTELEEQISAELAAEIDAAPSVAEGLVRAVGAFLDVCERPEVRRIALHDAPVVLGWETWRRIERRYALGVLTERLAAAGDGAVADAEAAAQLVFATACEAALMIAAAPDPVATRARVEPVLTALAVGIVAGAAG